MLVLSPVTALGASSIVATVDQNKVVSTVRNNEVSADPTNALALEAAARRTELLRTEPRSDKIVRLAAIQRVVRAQAFSGPNLFAHFSVFGLVAAGRDLGDRKFEASGAAEHASFLVDVMLAAGVDSVRIEVTDLSAGRMAEVDESIRVAVADRASVVDAPGRSAGRGYYQGMCFSVMATAGERTLGVADGGFVDWTRKLAGNAKERLMISGLGLDRLAQMLPEH
jgi:hypothetical protein